MYVPSTQWSFSWLRKPTFATVSGWTVSDDTAGCGGPGLTWCQLLVVILVGCAPKFSKSKLEMAYRGEMSAQFTGDNSGGTFLREHANRTLP